MTKKHPGGRPKGSKTKTTGSRAAPGRKSTYKLTGKQEAAAEDVPCPSLDRRGHGDDCPICHGSGTTKGTK